MKKLSHLMDYYYNEIYPDISYLEEERIEVSKKLRRYKLFLIGLGALLLFASYSIGMFESEFDTALMISVVAPIALYGFLYKVTISGYKSGFKDQVIQKIIHFIEPNLRYLKNSCISQGDFQWSGIFKRNIDRYGGNDLVSGKIGSTEIKFSDVHAEYKTKSKSGTQWHTIFQGLFFVADFHKNFKANIVVLPDFAQKHFGQIGTFLQDINFTRGDLVKMDNPAFEKEFVVYGEDQIEARYLLTQAMMERILEFKKKSDKPLYISFKNSKIFVAIEYNRDLFEPNPFKSLNDFGMIKEYYEDLALVIGIVEDFKLNTRIWSKK